MLHKAFKTSDNIAILITKEKMYGRSPFHSTHIQTHTHTCSYKFMCVCCKRHKYHAKTYFNDTLMQSNTSLIIWDKIK